MTDSFIRFREKQNIRTLELPNKEKYFCDIMMNIEHSFSGRIEGGNIINTFIMEASQQLINSIILFEKGFFDCAYYSLRSAIEVSTIMVFLVDMPRDEQKKYFADWRDIKQFPVQGQIIKMLADNGSIFADMKEKMTLFFANTKNLYQKLNKYVHKQGFKHFYVSRNHVLYSNQTLDIFISNFIKHLKECIGVVAVMRLAADPFPILLMDEEILLRCFDSMTDAYSQTFVDEYIGEEVIKTYKETELYKETYKSFIKEPKKNYATFNVMKYQYIDRNKMQDIIEQLYLLNDYSRICVLMVKTCDKIVKIYINGGPFFFFTEKETNRKATVWSSLDFDIFAQNDVKFNQPYDEAYISVFQNNEISFFIEHNKQLTESDIRKINETITREVETHTYD